jgi:F0F1-type ATP synthase assembly protein I
MPEDEEKRLEDIREYAHRAATQSPFSDKVAKEAADQAEVMREAGPYLTLGIQLVLTIGVFFGIGYWLDKHFATAPLWTAIFTAFGAVASLTYFIVTVIRLQKRDDAKSAKIAETKAK